MPSKRKAKKSQATHEIPCPQEARLERIEEDMGEQKECLIRIEEKLKNDYSIIGKIDSKLERLIEGNSSPGLPAKVHTLEQAQDELKNQHRRDNKLLWTIIILTLGGILTGFLAHIWPKAS